MVKTFEKKYGVTVWVVIKNALIGLLPLALLLAYQYFTHEDEISLVLKHGTETECVVIGYAKGKMGYEIKRDGYWNKCQFFIDDSIHFTKIFTTVKPLPYNEKITILYYKYQDGKKKGKVIVVHPDSMKSKYKEYGFNAF